MSKPTPLRRGFLWGNSYTGQRHTPIAPDLRRRDDTDTQSSLRCPVTYPALRIQFDDLALDIFENGPAMLRAELTPRVQELCGLALQTIAAAEGREDSQTIASSICKVLHRAYSLSSAAEQASHLRQRFPHSKMPELSAGF